jgi:hypothetical protein
LLAVVVFGGLVAITRGILWVSVALCIVATVLLAGGLERAFREPASYRGKVAGPILSVVSVLLFVLLGFGGYEVSRAYPSAQHAPGVGQKAPDFALVDSHGAQVALAQLLNSKSGNSNAASKGLLLVFYRGYW